MSKNRSSLENFVLLMAYQEKMRNTPFQPKTFLKKIRPYCKTQNINNKYLYVRIRGAKLGICIEIKNDCFVITQSYLSHEFIFYCDPLQYSMKILLQKLFKHNLLTA